MTTAGTASVNKKRIEYLVKEIIEKNKKEKSYSRKKFETKVKEFADFLNKQAIEHLNNSDYISNTTFIFTHYDRTKEQTSIYKVDINPCSKKDIIDDQFNYINVRKMEDFYRVVCDGQNRISERILFGEIDFFIDITPKIIEKVVEKLKIPDDKVPPDFVKDFIADAKSFLPSQFYEDMKIID